MYTTVLLFGLLACVHCQASTNDLDPNLQVVDTSHAASITKRHVVTPSSLDSGATPISELSSTLNQTLKPDTQATQNSSISCTMPNGKIGKCVEYHLCVNDTIVTDGAGILENRAVVFLVSEDHIIQSYKNVTPNISVRFNPSNDKCSSYDRLCCVMPDERPPTTTPKPTPAKPQREGCGWSNPDGVRLQSALEDQRDGDAKFAEFPWMLAVIRIEPAYEDDPEGQKINVYSGGGSLIHPSVALTSAANIPPGADAGVKMRVRAGEWDTSNKEEPLPYQDRDVWSIVVHEKYNKRNFYYDVALLFLEKPMELAPNVGLACLPPARKLPPPGTRCIANGWGKDKSGKQGRYQPRLKKVEIPLVDHDSCQRQLRKTRLGEFFKLHSSFECAGGEPKADMCEGDGGSPLACPMQLVKDRYIQSGIVAWGMSCGEGGVPGVYVDVANVRDWIDLQVSNKGYNTSTYEP